MKLINTLWILAVIGTSACTPSGQRADDPKGRLQEYISQSFAMKSPEDRKTLETYLTGDAKQRLNAWSDDQFREAFIDSKRKFVKLAFKEAKDVSPSESSITYELTYQDASKGNSAKVTNKKLCRMVKESGQWMIADVRNIQEVVEYDQEMSLP